ncbi:MAG TPA: N-acetylmuramic acid 6-phosphate etherase [Terriglobales bacterium]
MNEAIKLEKLSTEQINPSWADLDTRSSLEIARIINAEDIKVAEIVQRALPQIAQAIDCIADSLANGGRLIYVGTGTSGRIAALDASECPPTFDVPATTVQFVMAGGERALAKAVEADEDSRELGQKEIRKRRPSKKDVVVGIAASGRTPFTVAAVEFARSKGAKTIALSCNPNSPLEAAAELAIVVETGPEVVAGSTRMKAGTAEKMVLNILTTGAMVRLGYVYGNLMVNLHQKNSKLGERALRILQTALEISREQARRVLARAGNDVPIAIVMQKAGLSRSQAKDFLNNANGHVRRAIALAASKRRSPAQK